MPLYARVALGYAGDENLRVDVAGQDGHGGDDLADERGGVVGGDLDAHWEGLEGERGEAGSADERESRGGR